MSPPHEESLGVLRMKEQGILRVKQEIEAPRIRPSCLEKNVLLPATQKLSSVESSTCLRQSVRSRESRSTTWRSADAQAGATAVSRGGFTFLGECRSSNVSGCEQTVKSI